MLCVERLEYSGGCHFGSNHFGLATDLYLHVSRNDDHIVENSYVPMWSHIVTINFCVLSTITHDILSL